MLWPSALGVRQPTLVIADAAREWDLAAMLLFRQASLSQCCRQSFHQRPSEQIHLHEGGHGKHWGNFKQAACGHVRGGHVAQADLAGNKICVRDAEARIGLNGQG